MVTCEREGRRVRKREGTAHLSYTGSGPGLALCEPFHADAEGVCIGALLFPHVDVARAEGSALVGIEAFLDFWEEAELDGVEELVGVGGGADVYVCERGALHWRGHVDGLRGGRDGGGERGRGRSEGGGGGKEGESEGRRGEGREAII